MPPPPAGFNPPTNSNVEPQPPPQPANYQVASSFQTQHWEFLQKGLQHDSEENKRTNFTQ